ncbi:Holliday junction resolvase RuvX [bacterium]|nr:Holliday junction resolvase RuvX [bacterium]
MISNILAMDLGRSSLGLAISRSGILASTLTNIHFKMDDYDDCIKKLMEVIKFEKIEHIVMGLPLYPSGDRCEMTPIVENFLEKIKPLFPNCDFIYQDERDSTLEASEILHDNNQTAKKQKKTIDSHAALVILERYLRKINQI